MSRLAPENVAVLPTAQGTYAGRSRGDSAAPCRPHPTALGWAPQRSQEAAPLPKQPLARSSLFGFLPSELN